MGGAGSGRTAVKLSVTQCRCLSVAELCDGGRLTAQPRGEVQWRAAGELRGRLTYAVEKNALFYRYWPMGKGNLSEGCLELTVAPGRPTAVRCPACGSAVRSLYAPPRVDAFACRSCCGLVYRRSTTHMALEQVRSAAGPTLALLGRLPAGPLPCPRQPRRAHMPQHLAEELEAQLPLARQELRLWSLRLRSCGLSYRRIAGLLESSKSSVARSCQEGKAGIDAHALIRECLERAAALPPLPDEDDPRALTGILATLQRHALARGLRRFAWERPQEERVVLPRAGE